MTKADKVEEIKMILTTMKPELQRLQVFNQFDLHAKIGDLPATDISEAYEWIKNIHLTTWKDAHFFYKRHPEDRWDYYLSCEDSMILDMYEVRSWLDKSKLFRKSLKKRPTLFKLYIVQKLTKPKMKRGRKPNVAK